MTNEDIIRMARETLKEDDGECYYAYAHQIIHWWGKEDAIVKFANLVAAAEREACAKLCDENTNPNADKYEPVSQYQSGCYITAEYLAEAIRGRGQE
jgi:hypothetical protein